MTDREREGLPQEPCAHTKDRQSVSLNDGGLELRRLFYAPIALYASTFIVIDVLPDLCARFTLRERLDLESL